MSSSKGEVEPTGTSGKESRKDSMRRSSTATQGWSNHSRSKWFIDWCCGDASNPTAQPCGPVIFIDDSRRRRVLGAVLRWEDAKGGRRHFYMQKVYGAKGNVVAYSKGTLLDLELCEVFGAGAVNTPFYRELVLGGGFVLAGEFFDMLEDKNIALDVPCDVNPSLELSLPLKLCSGCESSGAGAEGGDLGSAPATQLHRGESRVHVAAYSEVDLEASEGQVVEEVDAGGLGSQGAPQKRRVDRPDEFAGSMKKLKSKIPRTAGEKRKGTEGEQGRQVAKRPSSRQKQPESGPSSPPTIRTPIDVDAGYFLEYKGGIRTKREFDISPAQVVDLGDWEDLYNQRSLDHVLVEGIKEAMRLAFENKAQSYDLPTLKLAPLGLDKPTLRTREKRMRPEDWRDELAGQYYYYAVLLGHDGAKWIMRKKKVKNVKPGVAYIHNDKLGRKEVVYNVPVEPPSKKGKKEKAEGEWFMQVSEPDAHCWKTMESLTDNEKCRVLKKVLACEVVWVQAGSPALAKLGKLSVQEVVNLVKCDRVLVRLWNYYQFKHDKRPDADWSQRFPFLKSRETAKFAGIRTSPGKEYGGSGDRETTKFAGIRTSSGKACGGPNNRESAKFVGIRTSSGKGGQPGILVQAGGATCGGREAHSSGINTGSGEVAALHAGEEGKVMDKEKEVEEGDKGEELEEGRDEGEEEEDEGEEGEETELAGLLGGQEGGKGELDTGDDERTFGDDDDRSGESSDGFGQLYGEHREEDDDDDDTTLGMETQVVTSLSAERDDYDVQAMTSVVDLQHRFNEARVAVSLTKPSVRIDIEEVIDDILGDHQMSAQPSSTRGVDNPLDV
ncbi:hypothetical protein CBR_g54624 [Chara braunii]|uniref:Uncharacterized protein n=1 Tax=Chara braunii TaxID=69332 RepID=A0A388MC90_CHABU|nr:hypothetical protein CBR_g54624 [Chara braunii]|eukprot:GBG92180.1 hypothetical protein CBR_g54624 [Chara braunii]